MTQENATPQDTQTENQTAAPEVVEVETATRRGRGRPKKEATGEAPKKETAASTPRSSKKKEAQQIDPGKLGSQLVGIHQLAVIMTGNQFPELALEPREGEALATAICGVCEHYNLSIDGKTGAFIQLLGVAAMIYAPRVMSIRHRMNQNRPIDVPAENAQ